jgi:hypothetical protein
MTTTTRTRDWRERNQWIADLLKRRTGQDLDAWNARVRELDPSDETALRAWLAEQGVSGYPQSLLVMERFGYPEFLVASSEELLEAQYRDRPRLRPIFETVVALAATLGEITVQVRKGFVSLVTPRRTFAAIQATTKTRVDLGLRLTDVPPSGRLESAAGMGSGQVTLRIALEGVDEVDDEVEGWMRRAYRENC